MGMCTHTVTHRLNNARSKRPRVLLMYQMHTVNLRHTKAGKRTLV